MNPDKELINLYDLPPTNAILREYGLDAQQFDIKPYGTGLINHTWRIVNSQQDYILQRINSKVFEQPENIAFNIQIVARYFSQYHPGYLFTLPVTTLKNENMVYEPEEGFFRLFRFIKQSHTIDVVRNPLQAYEASRQFGMFTRLLANLPVTELKITIPDFHNLSLRYRQLEAALEKGNSWRIKKSASAIVLIHENRDILERYEKLTINPNFKRRVTHHDTKISNVLFDANHKGLCVIDLDTLMPGFFISDTGDMMRTYLSPASEEERAFDTIEVREEFFRAILEGYLGAMKDELSDDEITHFVYSGKFMIYMQAIRFLEDYLNDDVYYGEKYPDHNLFRALNQLTLLTKLVHQEKRFEEMVNNFSNDAAGLSFDR